MITSLLHRLLLLCLCFPISVYAADDWLDLADGHAELIDEPVFGGKAWVYEAGRGKPQTVVLVHGLGTVGADDWKPLIPTLARDYHVITFDLPGFARSDKGNYLYTPATYARFIDFVVEHYQQESFHLVGHSMGGAISARYAAEHAQRIKTLTLIDAAGILHRASFQKHLAVGAIEKNIPPVYASQDAEVREVIMDIINRAETFGMGPNLVLAAAPLRRLLLRGEPLAIAGLGLVVEDFSDLPWRLKMPVQLIWGDRDSVAPLRTGKVLAANLPRTKLHILPGTGHNPMGQSAQKLLPVLRDFLASASPASNQPLRDEATTGMGDKPFHCDDQVNVRVPPGNYSEIIINGCKRVIISNVRSGKISISNISEVELENVTIDGGELAMDILDSTVTITNGRISGKTLFKADNSRVDVAGTELVAEHELARALRPSGFVFSLVDARTPAQQRILHDYVKLGEDESL